MTEVVLATGDAPPAATRSVTARALSILGVFSMERPSMTLSEISRATGLPVATVYRLAGELEQGRFLDRDEDGRYSLGLYLWEMGMLTPVHGRLREIAMPFMLNLQYTCRETVQLAVIDGVDAIYIEKLTMVESAPVQSRIGARIPVTSRRLVQLATLDGAVDLGIADRTGSLTPGKRADLILVRAGDINMAPIGDPYEALVFLGQPRNVELTMIDGRVLWRAGRFSALDHARIVREAQASVAALVQRAKWS